MNRLKTAKLKWSMPMFCLVLWLSPTLAETQDPASTRAFSRAYSFSTAGADMRLLNLIGADVRLQLGYTKGEIGEGGWRTPEVPGVEQYLLFRKQLPDGSLQRLEIARLSAPEGGNELIIYGLVEKDGQQSDNPDLSWLQQQVDDRLIRTAPKAPPVSSLRGPTIRYQIHQLSYVEADRALAMLGVLGFSTVRFGPTDSTATINAPSLDPKSPSNLPLPVAIRFVDADTTNLPQEAPNSITAGLNLVTEVLTGPTEGAPDQRLLLAYDESDPQGLERLVELLEEVIDVPARQILIEALVVEANKNIFRSLGFTYGFNYRGGRGQGGVELQPGGPLVGGYVNAAPDNGMGPISSLNVTISALAAKGDVEILSRPSILVLDGRQATIELALKLPVVTEIVTTNTATSQSIAYTNGGILLNLRPRINKDGNLVTMQVQAIASELVGQTELGPTFDAKVVESFVRVANNTPFIIAGLRSSTLEESRSGVPVLSEIPVLGALFRSTTMGRNDSEIMIIVIPHVLGTDQQAVYLDPDLLKRYPGIDPELLREWTGQPDTPPR